MRSFFLVFAGLLLVPTLVLAGSADTLLDSKQQLDVRADGGYSKDVRESYRVNDAGGIKVFSQYPLSFSPQHEVLTIVEAYTRTPDGRRIDVTPDKILLQQTSESADAPLFDDRMVKNVVFPALEVGATVTIHYRRDVKRAILPGVFWLYDTFPRNEEVRSADITIRAPASLPLYAEAIELKGGEEDSGTPGVRQWHWHLARQQAEVFERGAVDSDDVSPRLAVTSLPSYDELGRHYSVRATPQAAVTPYIATLAREIMQGSGSRREAAARLYRWVQTRIRYVAIYLGDGGVVPHEAETIARVRYGDCKDHVTLYQALLAAVGIESRPVLVNAEYAWWVPKVALPLGIFNHAINYLPEFDLYADSTALNLPFGVLTDAEQGKPALVIANDGSLSSLRRLPVATPQSDQVRVLTHLKLEADGSLVGRSEVEESGVYEYFARQVFASLADGEEPQAAATGLRGKGLLGNGDLHEDLAPGRPYRFLTRFELPDFIDPTAPAALIATSGLESSSGLSSFARDATLLNARKYPMPLLNGTREETVFLKLGPASHIGALPRNVDVTSRVGRYQASYRLDGDTVIAQRKLTIARSSVVLPADEYDDLHRLGRAVARDLRTQILLP